MVTQELIAYVKQLTQQGLPADTIKETLRSAGWIEADIDRVFITVASPLLNTPPAPVQAAPVVKPQGFFGAHKILIISSIVFVILIIAAAVAFLFIAGQTAAPLPAPTTEAPAPFVAPILPVASSTVEALATTTPITIATSTASSTRATPLPKSSSTTPPVLLPKTATSTGH